MKKAKTIEVLAYVRYPEDAYVNGTEDTEGDLMPLLERSDIDFSWQIQIDIETGSIIEWELGTTAEVHYKVCDQCTYHILDEDGKTIESQINDNVAYWLSPKRDGYGDYIIMDIDANGFIKNFNYPK